jgi:hypothetical protein
MNDLVWGDPGAARWGLLVIALLFGFIWLGLWRRRRMTDLAKVGPLPSLLDAARPGRLVLRGALVLGAALLLVMALMRPQQGTRATELKNLGIDIAVVLDASKSMKVADVVPDRLQAAKLEIHKLLDGMHGGRVGLVPFAGLAFIQTPLTSDFDVIGTYLINAEGQVMGTVKARDGATPMFSELNERLLREIAVKTGGDYFHLGPAGGLQRLRKSIDTLEKQEYEATFKHLRDDRFQLAVIPALLLLILEALLSGRRRRRKEHA